MIETYDQKDQNDHTGYTATYKVPEVARQLRCGPRAVYRLIQEGALPHLRLGRNLLIPKIAFHRWLNKGGK